MYERRMLGLDEADRIVDAIIARSKKEKGPPLSIAVVDYRGDFIKFVRMDGASWNTIRMAQAKAYSAAKLRHDTSTIGEWTEKLGAQLADWTDPNVTSIGGGVCVRDQQVTPPSVVGAVGVSGFPQAEVDEEYARLGIAALG